MNAPIPIGFLSDESINRLLDGGNGSRGTVPLHATSSKAACKPLFIKPPAAAIEWKERDEIATQFCAAIIAKGWVTARGFEGTSYEDRARWAYEQADAMLAAREVQP